MDMKLVALKSIKSSPFNSRKTFDAAKMKELTASVQEKGILNPVLVRPSGSVAHPGYELVCGERRMRAAVAAGLEEIPAVIRPLTDQQALECMVIENLQREDVHPLEEAEGYEQLMKKHGYKSVDDIAAKIGKSKAYVYGRLKLCDLIPENRKFFFEGKFSPAVALLVARVPAHLQREAGGKVANGEYGRGNPMTPKGAQEYLHQHFMLQLKEAQFDTKEKGLGGKVSCLECPKRTGSQKELFSDIQGADICTDPVCFEAKKNAFAQRSIDALKKQGKTVVSQDEAKKLFPYQGRTTPEQKYAALDEEHYYNHKFLKLRSILKSTKDVKIIYAVHPYKGNVIEMVDKADLPRILKNAGIKESDSGSGRVKNLAKAKTDNRIREARYGFWLSKVAASQDTRVRNVIILDAVLTDLGAFNEAREVLKGKIKGAGGYGRCFTPQKLYELGDAEVLKLIAEVARRKAPRIDDDDLEFLAGKLGFSMAKDYVITEAYLEACTKEQLLKLDRELGYGGEVKDESWKKSALVAHILKHAPKGKVPKELVK
jgi:ParB/RepB/Spo0J family partition protein